MTLLFVFARITFPIMKKNKEVINMLHLLYFVGYLLVGVVAILLVSVIHIVCAIMKGYKVVKYWNDPGIKKMVYNRNNLTPGILGLIIWPIRIVQFIIQQDKYYEAYESYQTKPF